MERTQQIEAPSSIDQSTPLVSVAVTAFNSEKWLAEAVNSALRQDVDFPLEIVIGDDFSSDGTIAMARGLEQQHPGTIRVLERTAKLGMQRNYFETFEQCRGRYIAWLDADDCWTDPHKLRTQVQFLEADPTISICSHFVRAVTAAGVVEGEKEPLVPPGRYGIHDIIRANFVPSLSIMFRNGAHRALPEAFFALPNIADWPLLVQAALTGDILLIDKTMADLRITPGSAYTSRPPLFRERIDIQFYEYLAANLPNRFLKAVNAGRAETYRRIAYALRLEKDFRGSRTAALQALKLEGIRGSRGSLRVLAGTLVAQALSLSGARDIVPH